MLEHEATVASCCVSEWSDSGRRTVETGFIRHDRLYLPASHSFTADTVKIYTRPAEALNKQDESEMINSRSYDLDKKTLCRRKVENIFT